MRRAVAAAAVVFGLSLGVSTSLSAQTLTRVEDNISKAVLANGMEVVVIEDHSLPLVTIEVVVRNGAFTEPPDYNGLSHLYEHMFFKGNEALPDQEAYMARQRELGMRWNGTTSTERVNYFFTLPSDRWNEGMVFMRDAIRYPLFNQEELEKERIVVLDELSRNESNPYFHLRQEVDLELWYEYPSRKNTIGDRDVIASATREQMLVMQGNYYVPNNSAIFVSGNVEPAEVLAKAKELYGDWKKQADPFVANPLPEHPALPEQKVVIVEQPIDTVAVQIAWHGPDTDRDVKATYAADVFSFVLSQQGSSFQKALVDSGITLGAGISYYTQKNVGPISISFQCTPDKLEESLKAVAVEIGKLNNADYYTDEQVAIAKTLLEVDDIYAREKTSAWTHTLTFWWSSAGLDYYLGYVENLRQVERSEMERYVDTYIIGKPHVVGVLMSSETREQYGFEEAQIAEWFGTP